MRAHPPNMDDISEDDIFEEIVRDITVGVGSTGIRAGIIGEVGCSYPLSDNERKALRASARAQRATGAAILIHPGRTSLRRRRSSGSSWTQGAIRGAPSSVILTGR